MKRHQSWIFICIMTLQRLSEGGMHDLSTMSRVPKLYKLNTLQSNFSSQTNMPDKMSQSLKKVKFYESVNTENISIKTINIEHTTRGCSSEHLGQVPEFCCTTYHAVLWQQQRPCPKTSICDRDLLIKTGSPQQTQCNDIKFTVIVVSKTNRNFLEFGMVPVLEV